MENIKSRTNKKPQPLRRIFSTTIATLAIAQATLSCNPWPNQGTSENTTLVAPQPEQGYKSKYFNLLSWNIHRGRNKLGVHNIEGTVAKLAGQKFDVGCLQEVTQEDSVKIVKSLGKYIGLFTPTYRSALNTEYVEGNMLLISTSMKEAENLDYRSYKLPEEYRQVGFARVSEYLPRTLTIAELGDLVVFNTHLEARNPQLRSEQAVFAGERIRNFKNDQAVIVGCSDSNEVSRTSTAVNALTPNYGFALSASADSYEPSLDWLFGSQTVIFSNLQAIESGLLSDHDIITAQILISEG